MKTKWWLAVGMVLVGLTAWGVAERFVDRDNSAYPMLIEQGLYVGKGLAGTGTTRIARPDLDTKNKVTRFIGCQCDLDFPAIAPPWQVCSNSATLPNTCSCPGVKLGDPCFAGELADGKADAGSALPQGFRVDVIARAQDLVDLCLTNASDAGAYNPNDGGFLIRCISNQ